MNQKVKAEDLDLRREIVTRTKSYMLFIGFIVVVGSPLLSAVSIHFITTISNITEGLAADMPEIQAVGGITFGQLTLTPQFLTPVTWCNLVLTSLIASWLMAVISEGKDRYLVKYAVVIIPLSLGMFLVFDWLIGSFL